MEKHYLRDIGQGFIPKPLQRPHPPIVVTAVAPFSKGVTEAAARGWDPISANFLMPAWVKSHWPKYVEGCERAGRKADPANWRVAKSIFVADDDKTAKAYATASNSPYRYYYSQLFTKMKHGGRLELFKKRREEADNEVTLEAICNELVIYGTPDKVADDILAFRERSGISAHCSMPARTGPTAILAAARWSCWPKRCCRRSMRRSQRADKCPVNASRRRMADRAGVTAL